MSLAYDIAGLVARKRSGSALFELSVPQFAIAAGERIAIVGPSGSGKSTLLDLLALIALPEAVARFRLDNGDGPVPLDAVLLRGKVDALARIRRRAIGYVLQTGGLLPYLTVRQNVRLGCRLLGMPDDHLPALIARLGLADHLDKLPAALSIGERQRAAIARALAHRPIIIIADEPTASLDPVNALAVMRLFMEMADVLGATTVIASHDLERVAGFGLRSIAASLHGLATPGHMRAEFQA